MFVCFATEQQTWPGISFSFDKLIVFLHENKRSIKTGFDWILINGMQICETERREIKSPWNHGMRPQPHYFFEFEMKMPKILIPR